MIETKKRILEIIEQDPIISTREIGRELNISHGTVHRILKIKYTRSI